jgi:hypothetical protein
MERCVEVERCAWPHLESRSPGEYERSPGKAHYFPLQQLLTHAGRPEAPLRLLAPKAMECDQLGVEATLDAKRFFDLALSHLISMRHQCSEDVRQQYSGNCIVGFEPFSLDKH